MEIIIILLLLCLIAANERASEELDEMVKTAVKTILFIVVAFFILNIFADFFPEEEVYKYESPPAPVEQTKDGTLYSNQ